MLFSSLKMARYGLQWGETVKFEGAAKTGGNG
jgi:hypothetical protein